MTSPVAGPRGPRRQRAAWILSKYGGYRDATQAAAVDATVYHLLVGGAWRIDARRGARRIRQSGDPAAVARFARIMLRQSRHSAGAYSARLTASGADLGGTVAVTLTVLDGHGRPASGLPVTLCDVGGRAAGLGHGRRRAGDRQVRRERARLAGRHGRRCSNVPEHRLHVRPPEKEGQAAAAEGGARRQLDRLGRRLPVRGPQTLWLTADPGQLVVGSPARVVATVAGDGAVAHGHRSAARSVRQSAAAAQCTGAGGRRRSRRRSTATAPTRCPAVTPAGGGYYAWRVAVDGTDDQPARRGLRRGR